MARVRPFAAWRYASTTPDITTLVAPPYDVIDEEQRAELLAVNSRNVVALELPEGALNTEAADNRYDTGRDRWNAWRGDGTLVRDAEPAVYVLAQTYEQAGRRITRKAFVVELELEPFDAGVVLPHERTLPKALGDRYELTKATAANLSQVFGLYEDAERATDRLYEHIMSGAPVSTATDADNVTSTLWACSDPAVAAELAALLANSRVYIADGHHRYTTALAYRDWVRGADPDLGPDAPCDYIMMALVNLDDPDLVVLPTHRIADALGAFSADAFKNALGAHFELQDLPPGHPGSALEAFDRPAFLIKTREDERPFIAALRTDIDVDHAIAAERSSAWKHLDVAVLQELILDPLLGIHPDRPETLERLSFVKDAHAALGRVPDHDVTFILRATRLDQLREVAVGGETMPQKSTYFYPKLLSGLLFRGMDEPLA